MLSVAQLVLKAFFGIFRSQKVAYLLGGRIFNHALLIEILTYDFFYKMKVAQRCPVNQKVFFLTFWRQNSYFPFRDWAREQVEARIHV